MLALKTFVLFVLTAVAVIVGCYLPNQGSSLQYDDTRNIISQ
jgi:drug/metabolite transporter superfamily protein YnfA